MLLLVRFFSKPYLFFHFRYVWFPKSAFCYCTIAVKIFRERFSNFSLSLILRLLLKDISLTYCDSGVIAIAAIKATSSRHNSLKA